MSELQDIEKKAGTKQEWSLYLIRCKDNSLYCGISKDIDRRFQEHQSMSKKTAKYLRGRGPLSLVFHTLVGGYSEALKMESRFKALNKQDKEQLVLAQSLRLLEP